MRVVHPRARLLAALALVSACATPRETVVGRAFELTLPKVGGGEVSLAALRGKVVLVDVWATWCAPCVQSLPFYEDLEHALHGKGFAVVAVSVDADERAAPRFLRESSLTLTTALDPEGREVTRLHPVRLMPTAFLVGRDGTVRHVLEGFGPAEKARTRERVLELLAEP